jgi:metal-sulfur cluster biosynthetic enzyme
VRNPKVLEALKGVTDPELGVNIVDLGLVYRAERGPEGIEVTLTLSTRSCPLSEMIVEEVREALRANFADAPAIKVELVWDPPWTPDRMSEAARRLLG